MNSKCLYLLFLLPPGLLSCNNNGTEQRLLKHYAQVADNAVRWNDYATAADAWQNMYALDNANAPLLDSIFYAYCRIPNHAAASALGKDIADAHMDDERFMAALATAHKEAGNYALALEAFDRHSAMTPNRVPDFFGMGICLMEEKKYPASIDLMAKVMADTGSLRQQVEVKGQNVPYYVAALNIIGICEIKQGNTQNAEKAFTEALKLTPNFTSAANNLNMARQLR